MTATAIATAIDTALWLARAESALADLPAALADAASTRADEAALCRALAEREAELTGTVTGSNEAARKAALTLALRDDSIAAMLVSEIRVARGHRDSAEARATVAREEIRLARAVLALAAGGGDLSE